MRGRHRRLARQPRSLRQDVAASYDVLVVDDAPDPATARMVANWALRYASAGTRTAWTVRLFYVPNQGKLHGPGVARNLGWRHARAPVLAFTGDDTVAAVDWLRQGMAVLDGPAAWASAGATAPADSVSDVADIRLDIDTDMDLDDDQDAQAHAQFHVHPAAYAHSDTDRGDRAVAAGIGNTGLHSNGAHHAARQRRPAGASTLPDAVLGRVDTTLPKQPTELQRQAQLRDAAAFSGINWFCRRSLIERLGGFDERFTERHAIDTDMHFRLIESGARIATAPAAQVAHTVAAQLWSAAGVYLRECGDAALLYKKHPHLCRQRMSRLGYWHDLAVVLSLALTIAGLWRGSELLAVAAGGTWLVLTAMLSIRRLHDTAKTPSHIAAVLLTSLWLPPLALFWRLLGAARHRGRSA